jgi:hypothetical protein
MNRETRILKAAQMRAFSHPESSLDVVSLCGLSFCLYENGSIVQV